MRYESIPPIVERLSQDPIMLRLWEMVRGLEARLEEQQTQIQNLNREMLQWIGKAPHMPLICGEMVSDMTDCVLSLNHLGPHMDCYGERKDAPTYQPNPQPSKHPAVWHLVHNDMLERDSFGNRKYGTPLLPFNGRDVLKDAYEEALDLCVYLRQAIYERDGK